MEKAAGVTYNYYCEVNHDKTILQQMRYFKILYTVSSGFAVSSCTPHAA
ncbi:hypothetical protein [Sporomusa sp. GT1]|nr:hypothetical protein [Sporomusa sp. GT1]